MAPRKKATTPVKKNRTDSPKTEAVRQPPAPSSNGHDTAGRDLASGHDIAALAYELYMQRGGGHGHDLEDWLAAERQLFGREG